ncbi:Helicase associated domain protein [Streptomyces xanthochromogenes]|uniref:Helicase associated domain protein n=1 Tax=Streptomyces xanthochromogenes TaxID=67384 RepID=UPI0037F1867D
MAALTQWVEQEGQRAVPHSTVVEITVDGQAEPVPVKLGVWLSNTKSRRDKLTAEQLAALAALGMEWAGAFLAVEAAPEPPALRPAPSAVPPKRAMRGHHDECDKALYTGGTCTCDLVEQYGPPSQHDGY